MKDNLFNHDTFLARWMAGELSQAELEKFRQHPDYAFYERLSTSAQKLRVPQYAEEAELLFRIKSKANKVPQQGIQNNTSKSKAIISRRTLGGLLAAAAAVLFLIGYFTFFKAEPISYRTAIAEQQSIQLPDGSTVVLNAQSALIRPANNFKNNRRLKLNGEAYFEVKEGSTFSVLTDNGTVTVLGTEFSVYSRGNQTGVTCKSGSVRVENNAGKSIILNAGKRVYIIEDRLTSVDSISTTNIATWTEGVSSFESEYLGIVAQAIESQFDTQIILPKNLADERFTGSFLHNDLETALRMVFGPMNLEFRKIDDQQWEVLEK